MFLLSPGIFVPPEAENFCTFNSFSSVFTTKTMHFQRVWWSQTAIFFAACGGLSVKKAPLWDFPGIQRGGFLIRGAFLTLIPLMLSQHVIPYIGHLLPLIWETEPVSSYAQHRCFGTEPKPASGHPLANNLRCSNAIVADCFGDNARLLTIMGSDSAPYQSTYCTPYGKEWSVRT